MTDPASPAEIVNPDDKMISGSDQNIAELIEKKKRLEQELEQNELELKLHDSSKKTNERT